MLECTGKEEGGANELPKITDITEQKRAKGRSNIFVDGHFFAGASNYVIRRLNLSIGTEVIQEQLEKVIREDSIEKAKGYVVDYQLGKSRKMIQDKLKEKGYDAEVIGSVMDFLDTYKLVNDQEYARRKTNDVLRVNKKGTRVISQTLKQKGISDEDIELALESVTDEEQWEIATKALSSKVDGFRRKAKDKYDFKNKCYAFLMRRGFPGEIIQSVLETVSWEEENHEL